MVGHFLEKKNIDNSNLGIEMFQDPRGICCTNGL